MQYALFRLKGHLRWRDIKAIGYSAVRAISVDWMMQSNTAWRGPVDSTEGTAHTHRQQEGQRDYPSRSILTTQTWQHQDHWWQCRSIWLLRCASVLPRACMPTIRSKIAASGGTYALLFKIANAFRRLEAALQHRVARMRIFPSLKMLSDYHKQHCSIGRLVCASIQKKWRRRMLSNCLETKLRSKITASSFWNLSLVNYARAFLRWVWFWAQISIQDLN